MFLVGITKRSFCTRYQLVLILTLSIKKISFTIFVTIRVIVRKAVKFLYLQCPRIVNSFYRSLTVNEQIEQKIPIETNRLSLFNGCLYLSIFLRMSLCACRYKCKHVLCRNVSFSRTDCRIVSFEKERYFKRSISHRLVPLRFSSKSHRSFVLNCTFA